MLVNIQAVKASSTDLKAVGLLCCWEHELGSFHPCSLLRHATMKELVSDTHDVRQHPETQYYNVKIIWTYVCIYIYTLEQTITYYDIL